MGVAPRHVVSLIIANLACKIAAIFMLWKTPVTAIALWFGPDALIAYHVFTPRAQGLVRWSPSVGQVGREIKL
jgi:hypothetical protein